ncbi:hypothetical protein DV515_00001783 [Chloebia gouldiae]|uniref:G-protein coupled receptors family 1 profile domain-containing protein n=1 Tax=Chloebia gouldiae TaxID=44316 RepID=A0A3L8SZ35_CHLGU|nr:hypothetical protein DV515_00001783 [Chloebia gouldiae]
MGQELSVSPQDALAVKKSSTSHPCVQKHGPREGALFFPLALFRPCVAVTFPVVPDGCQRTLALIQLSNEMKPHRGLQQQDPSQQVKDYSWQVKNNMYQEYFGNMTEGTRNSSDSSSTFIHTSTMSAILVTVYSVAFAGGGIGSIAMSFVLLKMNTLSVTTTAIINLVVVHSLLLFTVPFRLHYYVKKKWVFDMPFCKMVSAMVHIHMYLTFIFYVITLVIRWLIFFQWRDKVEFYRKLHAIGASAAVWVFVMVFVVPLFYFEYGRSGLYNNTTCFKFHKELQHEGVKALNYTTQLIILPSNHHHYSVRQQPVLINIQKKTL